MTYHVTLKKRVIKALQKINEPYYSNIKKAIYNLGKNPRPIGYKKLIDRSGYRIRIGDYRIIYDIFEDVLVVNIIDLGQRKDIYG